MSNPIIVGVELGFSQFYRIVFIKVHNPQIDCPILSGNVSLVNQTLNIENNNLVFNGFYILSYFYTL